MSGKYGLIIANTEYNDPGLAQLTAPGKDAKEFWRVLNSPDICAFNDVILVLNQDAQTIRVRIDQFFSEKRPDDLLLLYFSGHGVRDENGTFYLAVKDTNRKSLRSTAISSSFIKEIMDDSRSNRQILVLDCCNSGAFAQGTKAATGGSIGTATAFGGYGHVVLTASDSTQYAWEGDQVISGETENSLFTYFLIKGLEGEADRNGDGQITVDELYDYAFEEVRDATSKQTPSKFSTKQQGEILLRENMRMEDVKAVPLSDDLIGEIEDTRPYVREAAVQKLEQIIKGKNLGKARSARAALEKIAKDENTTKKVSNEATKILNSITRIEKTGNESLPPIGNKEKTEDQTPSPVILQPPIQQKAVSKESKPAKSNSKLRLVIIGGVILSCICGAIFVLPSIFASPPPISPNEMTGTAIAQATEDQISKATATAKRKIEQATSTAVAYATQTQIAIPTITAHARDQYISALIAKSQVIFESKNGKLDYNAKLVSSQITSSENTRDFIATATFKNPYPTTIGAWSYGFEFRVTDSSSLRIYIDSDKRWTFSKYDYGNNQFSTIKEGYWENIELSDGGINKITIYCEGSRGLLYVNDDFISELDLSENMESGIIYIATGFVEGQQVIGYSTEYTDLKIWKIS